MKRKNRIAYKKACARRIAETRRANINQRARREYGFYIRPRPRNMRSAMRERALIMLEIAGMI